MNTPDTQPQGETRTLAQQIRACADAVTTAALLDRRHVVAATLRDLADRAAETEQERDRQWQLKETAQGEIASARLRAEHIKRYTDALTTAADTATPAHIVGALQYHTAQLLRLLGTGSAQDGPERNAAGRAAALATNETQPDAQEPQEAAEPLVHAELTTAVGPNRGQGTGYALCDNGDGTHPGGTLAHSSWQVNCEKCLAWPDEPGGEQ